MRMAIERKRISIADLRPYPGNARRGNLDVIKESLQAHGQYRAIVVQESTGYVLAGNHTMLAAKELGMDALDCDVYDCDDEQAKRIVLVDNRSNDLAEYDNQALADLLTELDSLEGTGFTDQDLNSLLASLGPGHFSHDELNMVIKVPVNPVTKPGDYIQLGPHELYCTDAVDPDNTVLWNFQQAECDAVWTDPPYLISYQVDMTPEEARARHRRTDGKEITNESMSEDDAIQFRIAAAKLIDRSLKPGGPFYVFVPPGPDQADWINALTMVGIRPRQVLQWVKDQFVFGRSDYHYRSEPILYGWKTGEAHVWEGDRSQDTVWECDRPKRSKDHPTIKPVDLAIKAIENSTRAGDTIFDPFAGSGTILTACMQTGRRAVMCEIDPAYCDVIIERYERLSGEKAKRIAPSDS